MNAIRQGVTPAYPSCACCWVEDFRSCPHLGFSRIALPLSAPLIAFIDSPDTYPIWLGDGLLFSKVETKALAPVFFRSWRTPANHQYLYSVTQQLC
jgi:hypothetical protein